MRRIHSMGALSEEASINNEHHWLRCIYQIEGIATRLITNAKENFTRLEIKLLRLDPNINDFNKYQKKFQQIKQQNALVQALCIRLQQMVNLESAENKDQDQLEPEMLAILGQEYLHDLQIKHNYMITLIKSIENKLDFLIRDVANFSNNSPQEGLQINEPKVEPQDKHPKRLKLF